MSVSHDAKSPPRMPFADLLATVQLLEASGRVLDSFVETAVLRHCCARLQHRHWWCFAGKLDPHVSHSRSSPSCSGSVPGRGQYCPIPLLLRGVLEFIVAHRFKH